MGNQSEAKRRKGWTSAKGALMLRNGRYKNLSLAEMGLLSVTESVQLQPGISRSSGT